MPSDWIRPNGCEGGSCVEYRTNDGFTYVRNPDRPGAVVAFTAAEWDTFVAGLVAPVAAERDNLRENLITECARAESLAAENARLRKIIGDNPAWARYLAVTEDAALRRYAEDLAAENRRMVAEAAVLRHRDRRTQEETLRALLAEKVTFRDLDYERMLPVVEAAVALHAADAAGTPWSVWRDAKRAYTAAVNAFVKGPETAPSATEPGQQPQPVAQPTDGPEPQGEAQREPRGDDEAIPRAIIRDWMAHLGYEPDEIDFAEADIDHSGCEMTTEGWDCVDENGEYAHATHQLMSEIAELVMFVLDSPHLNQSAPNPAAGAWTDAVEGIRRDAATLRTEMLGTAAQDAAGPSRVWDKGEGPVAWLHVPAHRGAEIHVDQLGKWQPLKRIPRVWNAGDPEPKGVEKVRDREGDVWTRRDRGWSITHPEGIEWAAVRGWAPLAEVLPEPTPTPVTFASQRFAVASSLGLIDFGEPDGEVPEAGRVGEAQTRVCSTCDGARVLPCAAHIAGDGCVDMLIDCPDCDPAADPQDPPMPAQDRTEVGLDAAIEAAQLAYAQDLPARRDVPHGHIAALTAAVRAASPLIERAALQARMRSLQAEMKTHAEKWPTDPWDRGYVRGMQRAIYDLANSMPATRTETP